MKLSANILVVVAMVAGTAAATGCSKPADKVSDQSPAPAATDGPEAVAPDQDPATAPTVDEKTDPASSGVEQDSRAGWGGRGGAHYYAPHGPPAARWEERGRAPSERHAWAPGYYRWNGREHVWYGGRWYPRRDGYEYIAPHWENRFGRWEFVPGHWRRV